MLSLGFRFVRNASRPLSIACRRKFHPSIRRCATGNEGAFLEAFQKTTVFEKLEKHPEAVAALEDFAELLQATGVDTATGKPPSTLQMIKLASNAKFRDSAKRVGEELQKAGVDIQSKEVMQEMMALMSVRNSGSSGSASGESK